MNFIAMLSQRKRIFPHFFLLLILLLTVVAPSWAEEFLLFYGNDVRGELQPCG
ncbi:hypothetical protein VU11_00380 [Desulfobulbus sp. US2]|nr:hypothetical protein [Desulfobulbus sp. US4]MCW5207144.1 hypothetical protein [Desulfobulbus sp. US2]